MKPELSDALFKIVIITIVIQAVSMCTLKHMLYIDIIIVFMVLLLWSLKIPINVNTLLDAPL